MKHPKWSESELSSAFQERNDNMYRSNVYVQKSGEEDASEREILDTIYCSGDCREEGQVGSGTSDPLPLYEAASRSSDHNLAYSSMSLKPNHQSSDLQTPNGRQDNGIVRGGMEKVFEHGPGLVNHHIF
jgi:hypothetical protein